jgi:hypothetical protein
MACLDFVSPDDDKVAPSDRCSWDSIALAIRRRAATLSAPDAEDLNRFANLLDGLAALEKQRD